MAEQPYVKLTYKIVGTYTRKNRRTKFTVTRDTARAMLDNVSLKGNYYFLHCDAHNAIDGPYTSTAITDSLGSKPWLWCEECAKIAGVQLPKTVDLVERLEGE